jgi:Flp pilus assembly protein TadD
MFQVYPRPLAAGALVVLLGLAGCNGNQDALTLDRSPDDPIFGSLPAEKSVEMGKAYYRHGHYGLAEQAFRQAVERDHGNAEAWLGLAASYDRLERFDRASQAYDVLVKLIGRTPTVLNNLGYHYLLRGDRARARETFIAALRGDPDNEQIRNNLALVADNGRSQDWAPRVKGAKGAR